MWSAFFGNAIFRNFYLNHTHKSVRFSFGFPFSTCSCLFHKVNVDTCTISINSLSMFQWNHILNSQVFVLWIIEWATIPQCQDHISAINQNSCESHFGTKWMNRTIIFAYEFVCILFPSYDHEYSFSLALFCFWHMICVQHLPDIHTSFINLYVCFIFPKWLNTFIGI